MDGVLVHNDYYHCLSWVEFGKKYGFAITMEEVVGWFGSKNEEILARLFGYELETEKAKELGDEKETLYRDLYNENITEVKGLSAFLADTDDERIVLGVATSGPADNVEFVLRKTGLKSRFQHITDASTVVNGKPHPEIFLKTAGKMGVEPDHCIVFEDSFHGIAAARKAGMKVIGVATTHSVEELKNTDLTIVDFTQIKYQDILNLMESS